MSSKMWRELRLDEVGLQRRHSISTRKNEMRRVSKDVIESLLVDERCTVSRYHAQRFMYDIQCFTILLHGHAAGMASMNRAFASLFKKDNRCDCQSVVRVKAVYAM